METLLKTTWQDRNTKVLLDEYWNILEGNNLMNEDMKIGYLAACHRIDHRLENIHRDEILIPFLRSIVQNYIQISLDLKNQTTQP